MMENKKDYALASTTVGFVSIPRPKAGVGTSLGDSTVWTWILVRGRWVRVGQTLHNDAVALMFGILLEARYVRLPE